ncbi:AAA family ATPase [Geodermatophilus sp. SYSU D00691]
MLTTEVPRARDGARSPARPVLVVVGGLPGSGKTTLLRRLLAGAPPGIEGFDSEQVTERLRAAGVRLPYRLLRPWVHLWHRRRVLRGIRSAAPVVVLTDPWTHRGWRDAVLAAAARAGRAVRLVLLDASAQQAAGGQTARGRSIPPRSMRRHVARWDDVLWTVADDGPAGVASSLVVDRSEADRLTLAELLPPR